ncbi:conserved hypothetical protein [Lodderomyces elongisporus NRRL YB-4239]|uniref:Metal resistance protein YCF1 n=1 Tax=Lodderomyces elongisporus (strain ATCC 11503 / CBS 2605 / JCM 1781 / NBRC 1676 / NRRL YB-4239) TaxID=379508 RepID=A5E0F6_LODEL|nr:conserved hypothetical protein [Lodderomyces elongisporus NRRL YB-4239]
MLSTEATCGWSSLLLPMVPHHQNAFNPCFLATSCILITLIFLFWGATSLRRLCNQPKYGSFSPKSTGFWQTLRVLAAGIEILLFITYSHSASQGVGSNVSQDTDASLKASSTMVFGLGLLCTFLIFIITPLQIMETSYSPHQLSVVMVFWPTFTILLTAFYFQDNYTDLGILSGQAKFSLQGMLIINAIIITLMEVFKWKPNHELILHFKREGKELELAEPNILEQITFTWMNDLIVSSYKNKTVTHTELPNTPDEISTKYSASRLQKFWNGSGLIFSLLRSFGPGLVVSFAYEMLAKLLNYVKPQLLRLLILYFAISNPPLLQGLLICFAMFATSLLQTSLNNRYMLKNLENGLNVRSSLSSLIYQKTLVLSNDSRHKTSSGDIINLMSVDVNRIQSVILNLSTLVLAPVDIILCIASLWPLLGPATLAGVAVMLVLIPVNAFLVRYSRRLNKEQMKLKDARTRITNEILSSIRSIKLYAWEIPMVDKLLDARNGKELHNLFYIRIIGLISNFVWYVIPILVSLFSFGCFVLTQSKPLTSDIVFPALTLIGLLSAPLYELPAVITSIIEAQVAIDRVFSFLTSDELSNDYFHKLPKMLISQESEPVIEVKNASFFWDKQSFEKKDEHNDEGAHHGQILHKEELYALKNVNFKVRKGALSCVVGKVGSGKTSLLYGLLGQMVVAKGNNSGASGSINGNSGSTNGYDDHDAENVEPRFVPLIKIRGSVAYCSQLPWIMNASVKENILFGCRFDKNFYNKTISSCQLTQDLEILPDGDETQVGEKGVSLSGGQKARLALARAVYARADIYLMDDILSAVDSHVGKNIINKVLRPEGLLGSKTVVLCTNSISILKYSSDITLIENGTIVETTSYKEINEMDHPRLDNLIRNFSNIHGSDDESLEGESRKESVELIQELVSTSNAEPECKQQVGHSLDNEQEQIPRSTQRRASIETFKWDPLKKLLPNLNSGQTVEESQKGKVKWSVYSAYFKACSSWGIFIWLLILIIGNILSVGGNYWLKYWTEENSRSGENKNVWSFLAIYATLGIGSTCMTMTRSAITSLWLAMNASRKIHDSMINRVLSAPMIFFERTPVGRIMNRFTNDINKIDNNIPNTLLGMVNQICKTLITLFVISIGIPAYAVVIIILSAIYFYYEIYYVSISRELKRLVSVSRSPIYSHLGETLNGLTTVRAYNQEDRFTFIMNTVVDFNIKSQYMLTSINRWLNFRLQFVGGLGVLSASLLSIFSLKTAHPLSASMVGFIMTYALQVTGSLRIVVRMSAEVESSIVAVERCLEYTELEVEEPNKNSLRVPSKAWPDRGEIEFKDYSTRYRQNLDLVLRGVNLKIEERQKVGVVGRTGSGKSTLALSIFRIINPVTGSILIDKVDTTSIPLFDLRHRLSIIPQDSQLFEGTVRQNLDPFNRYSDDEIWKALELAHLKSHILKSQSGTSTDKLASKVFEGGSNFSSGQRQLVALARVLLQMKDSRILVLDEATAAVDVETDKIIQDTIRKEFKDKTIITIAHRLKTVMDNDRIVGLDKGSVVEYDSPQELLKSKTGIFYNLCKQGGYIEDSEVEAKETK